jgi:DNA-binding response OmpR family regulator
MVSVVVVEDDPEIRRALVRGLGERGHAVESFGSGLPVLERVVGQVPDIVLLDLGLPDIDGLQLLAMIRAVSNVPVVVTTARDDDRTIVRALDAGADDYVVKPFGLDQVAARIRAILRRDGAQDRSSPLVVGELVVDPRTRTAELAGSPLELARKEFELLLALASRPNEVVTKRELLVEVWQQPYGGADRTIDVHLSVLRRKLGETAARPRYLHTVRGVGIRLVAPDPSDDGS